MGRVCCCGVPCCRPGSCEGWARPVGTPSPGPRSQLGPPRPSGRYWMGNGSICKESGAPGQAGPGSGPCRARLGPVPGPARAPCRARLAPPGPGPRALPGPACHSRAEAPKSPGRGARRARRGENGPGKPSCPGPSAAHRPARSLTAGPGQEGLPGPFCARAGRRGENRPGKSTLGGPGAATFDPAGARRCPCRARPTYLRPGPQLALQTARQLREVGPTFSD